MAKECTVVCAHAYLILHTLSLKWTNLSDEGTVLAKSVLNKNLQMYMVFCFSQLQKTEQIFVKKKKKKKACIAANIHAETLS